MSHYPWRNTEPVDSSFRGSKTVGRQYHKGWKYIGVAHSSSSCYLADERANGSSPATCFTWSHVVDPFTVNLHPTAPSANNHSCCCRFSKSLAGSPFSRVERGSFRHRSTWTTWDWDRVYSHSTFSALGTTKDTGNWAIQAFAFSVELEIGLHSLRIDRHYLVFANHWGEEIETTRVPLVRAETEKGCVTLRSRPCEMRSTPLLSVALLGTRTTVPFRDNILLHS